MLERCPDFSLMQPCTCKERRSGGLDVTCENVETSQLQKVTNNMKNYGQSHQFKVCRNFS